ncbi:LysR substrate-binding domain-containing protein, partial [Klebsiella pneumoniae]|nr:LysR substrate-binding domain-containing protein [Klebsiella pneumoniae]
IPLVKRLRETAPGIRVAVRTLETARLQRQMENGEVDLALISQENAPPGLLTQAMFEDRYALISRPDHPAWRQGVTLASYL